VETSTARAGSAPARVVPGDHLRRGQLFVGLGALAWSTAGLFQRELSVAPATQVGGRALFAMIGLLAFVAVSERGHGVVAAFRRIGRAGLATAACMAISSGTFILALSHTSVAHLLFIGALAPLVAALLARVTLGESLDSRSLVAMAIAFLGVALMLTGGGEGDSLGDVLAIVSMLTFAGAIVITRHRRDISMAPATCLSQLLVVVAAAPFARPGTVGGSDLMYLVLLGAVQIGLGLALLTVGARLIPAAQTALIALLEVVLGPLWVWIAYTEQPNTATLIGGAVVVVGILVQTGDPARVLRRAAAG
jgi:drug/metabolite transporter (DMT)-like permease